MFESRLIWRGGREIFSPLLFLLLHDNGGVWWQKCLAPITPLGSVLLGYTVLLVLLGMLVFFGLCNALFWYFYERRYFYERGHVRSSRGAEFRFRPYVRVGLYTFVISYSAVTQSTIKLWWTSRVCWGQLGKQMLTATTQDLMVDDAGGQAQACRRLSATAWCEPHRG